MNIKREEYEKWVAALKQKPDVNGTAENVLEDPEIIPVLLEIVRTETGSVKFTCDKIIRLVSEKNPALLYPFFVEISKFIDSGNNFIKWGAIITLSNLAAVDEENKFDAIYEKYFSLINSDSMITSANVASNAWKIALRKPELEEDITKRLLRVTQNVYINKGKISPECRNIVIGDVLDCFDKYFHISGHKEKMIEFAVGQRNNTRKSVAKRAVTFLERHHPIL